MRHLVLLPIMVGAIVTLAWIVVILTEVLNHGN